MSIHTPKFNVDVADGLKATAPVVAAPEPLVADDINTGLPLRQVLIKLAFAALLTACAVLEIFTVVQTVAQSTKRITSATQSIDVLDKVETLGQGILPLAMGLPGQAAQAEIHAQSRLVEAELTRLELLGGPVPVPGGDALRQAMSTLFLQAYSAVDSAPSAPIWRELATTEATLQAQITATRSAEEAISQRWLGDLVVQTRTNLFLLVAFLGGSVFLLSTVMVSGFREAKRRDAVETKLREQVEEARASEEVKDKYLTTMRDEIQRPLNTIIGFSEQLGEKASSPDQKQQADFVHSAGQKLSRIVDDVLDLSQIETGAMDLRDEPFSPRELFREAIDLVSVHSQAKRLILTSEVTTSLPKTLQGDPLRLSQVVLNLLNNAVKYTPEGYVTLRVSADEVEDDQMRLRIEVQDSGVGISDADQVHLFDQDTPTQRGLPHMGGSGLGLAISQGLVRKMGGEINIFSRLGEGATFWFYLTMPIVERMSEPAKEDTDTTVLRSQPMSVLLIDDSAETLQLVERILGREGVTVDTLANPEKALKTIIDMEPDVILCDMQMPQMSGMELTRQIRMLPQPYSQTPLIAFSSTTMQDEIEEMLLAGADAFVAKPFQAMDLVDAVCGVFAGAGFGMQPPTVPSDTFHELDELVELMGTNWTLTFVQRLSDRLEQLLTRTVANEQRAEQLHMIVAEAGQLGLRDLAWSATAYEQGLRRHKETEAEAERFDTHARTFLVRLPLFQRRVRTGE